MHAFRISAFEVPRVGLTPRRDAAVAACAERVCGEVLRCRGVRARCVRAAAKGLRAPHIIVKDEWNHPPSASRSCAHTLSLARALVYLCLATR